MLKRHRFSWAVVLLTLASFSLYGCGGGSGGSAVDLAGPTSSLPTTTSSTATTNPTTNPVANPANPANPAPPAPPVAAPPNRTADILFQFTLLRGIPTEVETIEFTGYDSGGQTLIGPVNLTKSAQIRLQAVPLAVQRVRFRLFRNTVLWGEGLVTVNLNADETFQVSDPDFTPVAQPTRVGVTPSSATLFIGETVQLTAVQQFNDSSVDDITARASWSIDNPSVAGISQGGLVQALAAGTTTITATGAGDPGTFSLTVRDPSQVQSLRLQGPSTLIVGTSGNIQATAILADQSTVDVSNDPSTTYQSLNPGILRAGGTGELTGLSPGSATVEVRHQGEVSRHNVEVVAASLERIGFSVQTTTLTVGQSSQTTVTGFYNNNTTANLTSRANLNSGNLALVTTSGSTISAVGAGQTTVTATVDGFSASQTITVNALPSSPGLTRLNTIRSLGALLPVTENPTYTAEAVLHSRYMVKNDFIGHSEDPTNPFYTVEGDRAARNSNLSITSNVNAQISGMIDGLMKAPFHGIGFIDPQLTESGFGLYCENIGVFRCGATVDVLRGRGPVPSGTSFPLTWPADGQLMPYSSYTGGEYPDPVAGLGGITTPTGAPIYVQFGPGNVTPNVTNVTLTNNTTSTPVTVGYFDETSYVNAGDSSGQSLGRAVLNSRDCLVIMASDPLTPGHRYTCSVTNSGSTHTWSFTVANPVSRRLVEPAIEVVR